MKAKFNTKKTFFTVTLPWDSASVGETYVFARKEDAEAFCNLKNKKGYSSGYCNGLHVQECNVIEGIEVEKEDEEYLPTG